MLIDKEAYTPARLKASPQLLESLSSGPGGSVVFYEPIQTNFRLRPYMRRYERIRYIDQRFGTGSKLPGTHFTDLDVARYKSSWKPCQHYKVEMEDFDDGNTYSAWRSNSTYSGQPVYVGSAKYPVRSLTVIDNQYLRDTIGEFGDHISGLPSMLVEQPDGGFLPPPPDLNILTANALKAMLPDVKAELSSINSIIELKDFKSLPHTITNLLSLTRNFDARNASILHALTSAATSSKARVSRRTRLNGAYARIRNSFATHGSTFREVLGGAADGYLQSAFNLLPTFQDIVGVYTALSGLYKQVSNLLGSQGKVLKKHYSFRYLPTSLYAPPQDVLWSQTLGDYAGYRNGPGPNDFGCYLASYGYGLTREVILEESVFHAEILYSYEYSKLQNEHARLFTLLDSLGVNLNPRIIWNAIPWSFVVDWVINVNRWLDDRKILNMEPKVSISQYLWSLKQRRRVRLFLFKGGPLYGNAYEAATYLPDLFESTYRRDISVPNHDSLVGSGLSSSELSLGVALAITRKKPLRNRAA